MVKEIRCELCYKKLKTDKSKKLGFGASCYKKYLERKKYNLFRVQKSQGEDKGDGE